MKWQKIDPATYLQALIEAKKIVEQSKDMKPRFGGGIRSHLIGKLAEHYFLKFLRQHGFEDIEVPAIRRNYSTIENKADFIVNGIKIELKSRVNRNKNKGLPFLYPKNQLLQNGDSIFTVWIEFHGVKLISGVNDDLGEYRIAGYIRTQRIRFFGTGKFELKRVIYDCYVVPASELSDISKLVRLLRGAK